MSGPRYKSRKSTRPRTSRGAAALLLAAAAALLLAGCGERGDVGIFASIEREEKIEKSNLPEVSTAGSMVYDSGTDTYYVALGQLYARDRSSNEWDEVDHPGGFADGHTLDIVNISGTGTTAAGIYMLFFDHEDGKGEIFSYNPGAGSYTSVWDPNQKISRLVSIDQDNDGQAEELYAVRNDGSSYSTYHITDGTTQTQIITGSKEVIDGAYVAFGTDPYVLITDTRIFRDATANGGAFEPAESPTAIGLPSDAEDFGGIWNSSNGTEVYIGSRKGRVHYWNTSWSSSGTDSDTEYLDGAIFDFTGTGGIAGTVVGIDTTNASNGGYAQIEGSAAGSIGSIVGPSGENYDAADLSDAAVRTFFVDTANSMLFALTNGTGLWSATYDTDEPEWRWE